MKSAPFGVGGLKCGSERRRRRTGRVGWKHQGADLELQQRQFLQTQGPVARREFRHPLKFPRAGRAVLRIGEHSRNGGLGESGPMDLGGAQRSRSPSAASPGDSLVTFSSLRKSLAAGAAKSLSKKVKDSRPGSPRRLSCTLLIGANMTKSSGYSSRSPALTRNSWATSSTSRPSTST